MEQSALKQTARSRAGMKQQLTAHALGWHTWRCAGRQAIVTAHDAVWEPHQDATAAWHHNEMLDRAAIALQVARHQMGEQPVKLVPVLPGLGCHVLALSDAPALVTLQPQGARMRVSSLALPHLSCAAPLRHPPHTQPGSDRPQAQ